MTLDQLPDEYLIACLDYAFIFLRQVSDNSRVNATFIHTPAASWLHSNQSLSFVLSRIVKSITVVQLAIF